MALVCYIINVHLEKYSGFCSWLVKLQGDAIKVNSSAKE